MSVHTLRPKSSSTAYQVEETFAGRAARLVLMPRTGRTHQIRAHLETVGHPIIGDKVYGGSPTSVADRIPAPRVMLHARKLAFQHPEHRDYCEFEVEAPTDFQSISGMLRLLVSREPKP